MVSGDPIAATAEAHAFAVATATARVPDDIAVLAALAKLAASAATRAKARSADGAVCASAFVAESAEHAITSLAQLSLRPPWPSFPIQVTLVVYAPFPTPPAVFYATQSAFECSAAWARQLIFGSG